MEKTRGSGSDERKIERMDAEPATKHHAETHTHTHTPRSRHRGEGGWDDRINQPAQRKKYRKKDRKKGKVPTRERIETYLMETRQKKRR